MKSNHPIKPRAFTLIELSVAMMIGMTIGAMVLALFNQQLAFLKIYKAQDFLSVEAPVISNYVSKLVGKADRFRLHDSLDDAKAGRNPRLTASPVAVLNFRQPDGTMRASFLSFEDLGSGPALNYYVVPVSGVLGTPQWAITNKAENVVFTIDQGVLRMSITGPAGELITYSGTMQQ
jgi:hypothetical protein